MTIEPFQGNARFAIERRLGAGGMGVVYRAFDRERGVAVALKTVRHLEPAALYRFKREFRALADVVHPNLVALHELVSEGDQWFFTMELVDGIDFLSYVRNAPAESAAPIESVEVTLPSPGRAGRDAVPQRAPPPRFDEERLRAALGQLAEGVAALHAAGKLHRDIKPPNVLVSPAGRVVLLDFGLVTELDPDVARQSTERAIVGTATYMAPEQAAAQSVTTASDWYSVGTILYEALTGRPPFTGSPLQILMDKQRVEPAAPSESVPSLPSDLSALCTELLRLRPELRPSGAEVLRRLGRAHAREAPALEPRAVGTPFVGRTEELAALREALQSSRRSQPAVVLLRGRSGIGKTAVVRRFLDELAQAGEGMILAGRCYERESVPFKAVDSIVDELSRRLNRLPKEKVESLLPRDVLPLARMFPVLRRVEAIATAPGSQREVADPLELRRRALAALRELLARIGDRGPLVVFVDDLQWGDHDSAALFAELLRGPDPPAMTLVGCYRQEDAEAAAPFHEALGQALATCGAAVRELEVEALSEDDARALASTLLGAAGVKRVAAVARESGGNPFFIDALARHAEAGAWPEDSGEISLDQVVQARTRRLPEPGRKLLEVVAVAGHPVPFAVAARIAELERDDVSTLAALKAGHLVRAVATGDQEELEAYHDRVREAIVAQLPAESSRSLHLKLALELEAGQHADPEALSLHFAAGGEPGRAAAHAAAAAKRAAEALAFERAALLYRRALAHAGPMGGHRREWLARLGDALANAGRGPEAAQAYLEAASVQPPLPAAEVLDLKRRAAEELLRSGHVDEGLAAIRDVLAEVGMTLAPTPRRALLSLMARRAYLALRGLSFQERDRSQVSAERLTRIDVCWSVAAGLSMVDTIHGASFQTRQLILALDAGEPLRVARALAAEAAFLATAGQGTRRRVERLIRAAEELGARVGDPQVQGLIAFCAALTEFLVGHWRQAQAHSERAAQILLDAGSGQSWEASNARLFSVWSLFFLGEIDALSRRLPQLIAEAEQRGDRYSVTSLRSGLSNIALLAADDPEGARAGVQSVIQQWSRQGFHFQHYWGLLSLGMTELYSGQGERAWERVNREWPALARSLLLRIQNVRFEARFLRARCALAASRTAPERRTLLRRALEDAAAIERERVTWARNLALLIRGGAAEDRSEAAVWYREAAEGFTRAEMALFAAAARRRAGEAACSAEEIDSADAWMRQQGVRSPERMTEMLAPR